MKEYTITLQCKKFKESPFIPRVIMTIIAYNQHEATMMALDLLRHQGDYEVIQVA